MPDDLNKKQTEMHNQRMNAEYKQRLATTRIRLHVLVVEAVIIASRLDDPHLNEYIKAAAYRATDDIVGAKQAFGYLAIDEIGNPHFVESPNEKSG